MTCEAGVTDTKHISSSYMTEIHGHQVQFRNARAITLEKPVRAIYHITRLSRNILSNF